MLSPHEFAVLLFVDDGTESDDLDRVDVEALIERQLVTLERRGPDRCYARVTLQGYVLLKASGHVRTSGHRTVVVSRQVILLMTVQPGAAQAQSSDVK